MKQFVTFQTPCFMSCLTLQKHLNGIITKDIAIQNITLNLNHIHPRFNCIAKTYVYVIDNNQVRSPFFSHLTYYERGELNISLMRKSAKLFLGEHNFKNFAVRRKNDSRSPIRKILKFDIIKIKNFIFFICTGHSFLHKMIRCLVGQLIKIGLQKENDELIKQKLICLTKSYPLFIAESKGLYLLDSYYEKQKLDFILKQSPFFFLRKLL